MVFRQSLSVRYAAIYCSIVLANYAKCTDLIMQIIMQLHFMQTPWIHFLIQDNLLTEKAIFYWDPNLISHKFEKSIWICIGVKWRSLEKIKQIIPHYRQHFDISFDQHGGGWRNWKHSEIWALNRHWRLVWQQEVRSLQVLLTLFNPWEVTSNQNFGR